MPIVFAAIVDVLFFSLDVHLAGWLNYLFIWLTVHQLGYAWHDGRLASRKNDIGLFIIGLASLSALVFVGPYPLSLVGVAGDEISNTLPPKLPLLALGIAQIGLFLSLERPIRRWLDGIVPWTGTVLINGMIMTLFLWHSTAMMLIIGLGFYIRPELFSVTPGSGAWWAFRPVWVAIFAVTTLPFLLLFNRFEHMGFSKSRDVVPIWRLYLGCMATGLGLAYLALKGIGGGPNWIFDVVALALPFLGAIFAGFISLPRTYQ